MTIIISLLTLSPLYLPRLVRLGGYIVNLYVFYSYSLIGKLTAFLQLQGFILRHFRHTRLKSKVDNTLTKDVELCINLNIDGTPIVSQSQTHTLKTLVY